MYIILRDQQQYKDTTIPRSEGTNGTSCITKVMLGWYYEERLPGRTYTQAESGRKQDRNTRISFCLPATAASGSV